MNKKIVNWGGAYATPTLRNINIRCEAGFQASLVLGDINEKEGAWDAISNDQE